MNPKNLISAEFNRIFLSFGTLAVIILLISSCQLSSRFTSVKSSDNNNEKSSNTNIDFDKNEFTTNPTRQLIINNALNYIGTPYCYGGMGDKQCFDCSGFVNIVYESVGISLPRVSADIFREGYVVDRFNAEPGDLVFFSNNGRINHVGIYLGNDNMIHSSTSKGVIIQSLSLDYYKTRLAGFKKYLK